MVRTSPFHGNNMGSNPIGGKKHDIINMSFIKTNFIKGYIYIRNHQSYGVYNACKIGKTSNLLERDKQYATGEIRRGYFEAVFEVFNEEIGTVEHLLKHKFREYNVKENAGTEFYDDVNDYSDVIGQDETTEKD